MLSRSHVDKVLSVIDISYEIVVGVFVDVCPRFVLTCARLTMRSCDRLGRYTCLYRYLSASVTLRLRVTLLHEHLIMASQSSSSRVALL